MVNAKLLTKITATDIKNAVAWLMKNDCGCFSTVVFHDKKHDYNYAICIGWERTDHGTKRWSSLNEPDWCLHTKIGRQSTDSAMQCDFDIDWEMPYGESGDVDDTCEVLDDPACYYEDEDKYWEWLAEHLNSEALRVVQMWC